MEIQSPLASKGRDTASLLLPNRRKRSDLFLFLSLFIGTLCFVFLLVAGGISIGYGILLATFAILIIVALTVRWPMFGFFVILGGTLLIEQDPLPVHVSLFDKIANLYVFHWPTALQGLPDRPIGFFMFFVLLVFIVHHLLKRQKVLQGGKLLLPYIFLLLCVVWGIAHGSSTGGNTQIIVEEVRSFWYLFLGYLFAYNLIRSKRHLRSFFWFVIICAAIKALQGVYIYVFVIHRNLTAYRSIMSHEESYFWISIVLLVVLFSLYYKYRPQFYTALALLPLIFIALLANNRRADYFALLVGLLTGWVLIFVIKSGARKGLIVALISTSLIGGAYVAAFSNGQGAINQPAYAILSIFHPDPHDAASNLYRDYENYDLTYTAKLNPLGLGFGKPFLQPKLLPDLSSIDPVYNLIPHNTILWVWMRLGAIGYLALWYLFGAIIVRGCLYARQLKDKYLQLIAIYIVCMFIMEIMVAYADYQLSFYRNVIYVGMLAGILMKLPTLDKEQEDETSQQKTSIGDLVNTGVSKTS
jgi:O-antigen ligase